MESYLIKIKELSKPIIEEYGFILVDVKKVVEFGAVISQVIIDDPKTFTLDIDIVGEIKQRILFFLLTNVRNFGIIQIQG